MVILLILIDMMHLFIACKVATKNTLHYKAMLKNISVWIGGGVVWHILPNISVSCDRIATFPVRTFGAALVGVAAGIPAIFVCVVGILDKEGFAAVMANSSILRGHQKLILSGVKPWDVRSVARAIRVFDWSHYTTPALEVRG